MNQYSMRYPSFTMFSHYDGLAFLFLSSFPKATLTSLARYSFPSSPAWPCAEQADKESFKENPSKISSSVESRKRNISRSFLRSFAPSLLPIRSPCDLSRDFYRARGIEFDSLKEVIPPMDDWCLAAAVCASRYLQKKRAKMQLISRIGTCPEGSDSTNTREQTLSWKKFFQHNFRVVAKLATPNLR